MFPELTRDEVFMIATKRLWLRWPQRADADALARIGGDPRVAAMTGTWPVGATPNYAHTRIDQMRSANTIGDGFAFVLAERSAWSKPIGVMGFHVVHGTQGAVACGGYHLAPDYWGRGYATEAMTGLISQLRLLTRIARLTASVMPHNAASAGVLRNNGFIKTGSGTMTTEARGTFALDHYARDLRLIGQIVGQIVGEAGALPPGPDPWRSGTNAAARQSAAALCAS